MRLQRLWGPTVPAAQPHRMEVLKSATTRSKSSTVSGPSGCLSVSRKLLGFASLQHAERPHVNMPAAPEEPRPPPACLPAVHCCCRAGKLC